jgi:hypothetical protein
VLGSGSLGLVYLSGTERLTLEEIDARYPDLVPAMRAHPGIGFVLVRSSEHGGMVLGSDGHRLLERSADDPAAVDGRDPLEPFGPHAVDHVTRVHGFPSVADLMVNATYNPVRDEIFAFEHQVGSHGGLGGPQTHPFLIYPVELTTPEQPIVGAEAMHRVLKGWLVELGHPAA